MVRQTSKKPIKHHAKKVDYEPNKMGLAVAALASVSLVLLAAIVTYT
jgi:hypothetical protein